MIPQQPTFPPKVRPHNRPACVAQLALLAAYARQDAAGRRALLDAAESVARGSDLPVLTVAAGRFLTLAR